MGVGGGGGRFHYMDDKLKQQEKETDYSVSSGIKTRQRRRWDVLRDFAGSSLPPSNLPLAAVPSPNGETR